MSIGIPGGDVSFVKLKGGILQLLGYIPGLRQLGQKIRYGMPPDFGSKLLEYCFQCFFRGLLGRKTGPVVEPPPKITPGMLQVALGLIHPICTSLHFLPRPAEE